MKVRVTKTMANLIKKLAKENVLKIESAEVVTMSASDYERKVDYNLFDAMDYKDGGYDDDGRMVFRAIQVTYPYDYYACSKYITTKEMVAELKRIGDYTMDGLTIALKNLIEI